MTPTSLCGNVHKNISILGVEIHNLKGYSQLYFQRRGGTFGGTFGDILKLRPELNKLLRRSFLP